jgi:hypothetical protein
MLAVVSLGLTLAAGCTPAQPRDPQPLFQATERPARPARPVRPRQPRPGENGQATQQANDPTNPASGEEPTRDPEAAPPDSATPPPVPPLDSVASAPPTPIQPAVPEFPPSTPTLPQTAALPTAPAQRVTGLRANDVRSRLGPPQSERTAGAARVWRYQGQGCAVDVYLYYDTRRGDFFALEQRPLGGGVSAESCLGSIAGANRQG